MDFNNIKICGTGITKGPNGIPMGYGVAYIKDEEVFTGNYPFSASVIEQYIQDIIINDPSSFNKAMDQSDDMTRRIINYRYSIDGKIINTREQSFEKCLITKNGIVQIEQNKKADVLQKAVNRIIQIEGKFCTLLKKISGKSL